MSSEIYEAVVDDAEEIEIDTVRRLRGWCLDRWAAEPDLVVAVQLGSVLVAEILQCGLHYGDVVAPGARTIARDQMWPAHGLLVLDPCALRLGFGRIGYTRTISTRLV